MSTIGQVSPLSRPCLPIPKLWREPVVARHGQAAEEIIGNCLAGLSGN